MTNDRNVFIAGDAKVTVAKGRVPVSEWPTTVDELLPAAFEYDLGFTEDDGEAFNRTVNTEVIDMHQQAAVRQIVTGGDMTLNLTCGEAHREIVKDLQYGVDKVGTYRTIKADSARTVTVCYDTSDVQEGYEKDVRLVFHALVIPDGAVTNTRTTSTGVPLAFKVIGEIREISEDAFPDEEETPEV